MPPNRFNSAHCSDRSMSRAQGRDHTIYLSNIGRKQGGVDPMTMYEGGTGLYRLDPEMILCNLSCADIALLLEPFHDLMKCRQSLQDNPVYIQLTGSTLMLTIRAPASIHAAACARHDTSERFVWMPCRLVSTWAALMPFSVAGN